MNTSITNAVRNNNLESSLAHLSKHEVSSRTANEARFAAIVNDAASTLGVSNFIASRLMRNLLSTGASLSDIRRFFQEYSKDPNLANLKTNLAETHNLEPSRFNSAQEFDQVLKPSMDQLRDKFTSHSNQSHRTDIEQLSNRNDRFTPSPNQNPLSNLVSSPKEFASWLVNNRAAFVMLKTNPELAYLMTALANPKLNTSPAMMAELLKLMSQLVKLKQGKASGDVDTEEISASRNRAIADDASDHEGNIVHQVKQTLEGLQVTPLRDFLLEAERFAEEEIANLWSLTLKKEREIEAKIKSKFKKAGKR